MIDATKLVYKIVVVDVQGKEMDLTPVVTNLSWEDGKGQVAAKITAKFLNASNNGISAASLLKLNAPLFLYAGTGSGFQEAARGRITDWEPTDSSSESSVSITAYDDLYRMLQSQDNRYYAAGTGSRAILTGLFKDWKIPLDKYDGPNISHEKKLFRNQTIADIILEVLEDARKKGGGEFILRSAGGKVSILKKGMNQDVYYFYGGSNVTVAKQRVSIADLVTRVKVIGKEDKEGRGKLEFTLNGSTKFGILQRIFTRDGDRSLSDARSEACEILKENGIPKKEITIESMDVPWIRKGDKVRVYAGTLDGEYFVESARHDAVKKTLSLDLEPIVKDSVIITKT